MNKTAALFALLSLIAAMAPGFQVQLTNTGNIIESLDIVYMQPSEVTFDWGTLEPGEGRDIFHEKVALLTANQQIPVTATLNVESAIHFNVIGIWIQVGPEHYFLDKTTSSYTWTIPAGVHSVYYDCTMYANTDITDICSGEVITNLTYCNHIVGIVKIQYTIISP